ncbi:hypothetical protein PMAYCL1PPCAC_13119, partial [Pristionchus mayeri]
ADPMCPPNEFEPLNASFLSFISWTILLLYEGLRRRPQGSFSIVFHTMVLFNIIRAFGASLHHYDGYIRYCYFGAPSLVSIVAERLIAVSLNIEPILVQLPLTVLIVRGRSAIWVLYLGFLLPLSTHTILVTRI